MRNKIISSLAGAAFSFAASGFAFAADLNKPVYKAPPPPPPAPVYSWTGWYVGGNVGYGWGNSNVDIGANGVVPNLFGGGPPFTPSNLAFSGSHSQELEGVIGGGQIGYNYQFSPNGVLGFEADIQASGQRATNNFVDSSLESLCFDSTGAPEFRCLESLPPGPVVGSTAYEAKIDWFGTVRARLGVLATDAFLVYATGGLAYGRVGVSGSTNFNATFSGLGTICPPCTFAGTTAFDQSNVNVGYAVGGGIEGRLSYWLPPNWTWKLEYLYLDLGSLDTSTPLIGAPNSFAAVFSGPFAGTVTTHTHFTDNIVRVGLNYKFTN